ncbi:MAG: MCP four helix bundle domain-containing protein, partial [Nitrospirae bacterium]|nr:MCP four helix bundle domain-containing protein [Nitrospirota bacterium]
MRLRDVGVGKRLGVGFSIITALMLVIGIFAFTGLSKLYHEVETIVSDRLPKVVM